MLACQTSFTEIVAWIFCSLSAFGASCPILHRHGDTVFSFVAWMLGQTILVTTTCSQEIICTSGLICVGRGIRDDFVRKIGVYFSDWTDAFHSKVGASTFFIFFTSVGPAITFSLLLAEVTDNQIGAIEVLLATSITGILFALFAGQPLIIVGVTGPVSILTVNIFVLSKQWGVNFIPFYAWSQFWGAAMLILLAVFNACDTVKIVTRFSCEIFGILIAMLYLYTGIDGIVKVLGNQRADFGACVLQFVIAMGTYYLAQTLTQATSWVVGNSKLRELAGDYGATLSILLWSVVPTLAANRIPDDSIPKLYVPLSFQTTSGRAWLVDYTDLPIWAGFAAIFPGFIIAVLFFFDHNVSSLLAQSAELKLRKGDAFHLDLLVLGVRVVLTGLLGLPPTNGLIPQAPLHTKSLAVIKRVKDSHSDVNSGVSAAADGGQDKKYAPLTTPIGTTSSETTEEPKGSTSHGIEKERATPPRTPIPTAPAATHTASPDRYEIVHVHEQRVSNLLQSVLCGVVCFRPFSDALREIPTAVLYGLFLFLGVSSFEGNEFAYRMFLLIMDPRKRQRMAHPFVSATEEFSVLRRYTLLQAALCAIIFGVTFTDAGVIFPVLIAALIAVRSVWLPRWFTQAQLSKLDSSILSENGGAGVSDADGLETATESRVIADVEGGPGDGEQASEQAAPTPPGVACVDRDVEMM